MPPRPKTKASSPPARKRRGWLGGWFRKAPPGAAIPRGRRVYAVGDIHGRLDLLDRLLKTIRLDATGASADSTLVFVGDYVDRGAQSKGVIDRLLALRKEYPVHYLRGNHDQAVLDFLEDPGYFRTWKEFGAVDTLLSYGVVPPLSNADTALCDVRDRLARALPREHRAFFEDLPLFCEIGDYFFAHAGVRPGIPLAGQSAEDLLWIRDSFLNSSADFGKVVVHGHTPAETPVRKPNRIGIDTGAYASGCLTAVVLEGTGCRFLQTA